MAECNNDERLNKLVGPSSRRCYICHDSHVIIFEGSDIYVASTREINSFSGLVDSRRKLMSGAHAESTLNERDRFTRKQEREVWNNVWSWWSWPVKRHFPAELWLSSHANLSLSPGLCTLVYLLAARGDQRMLAANPLQNGEREKTRDDHSAGVTLRNGI